MLRLVLLLDALPFLPVLWCACTTAGLQVAYSHVVYVIPNVTTPCPRNGDSSCYTLSCHGTVRSQWQWEAHVQWHCGNTAERNSHLELNHIHRESQKSHYLQEKLHILHQLVRVLILIKKKKILYPVSRIQCTAPKTGIVFLNSRDIKLMNLGLDSCGSNIALNCDTGKLVEFNVCAALLFRLSYSVSIIRVIVNNTYGYGLHIMNCVFGNIWIN